LRRAQRLNYPRARMVCDRDRHVRPHALGVFDALVDCLKGPRDRGIVPIAIVVVEHCGGKLSGELLQFDLAFV
jgi:hypothetical protein